MTLIAVGAAPQNFTIMANVAEGCWNCGSPLHHRPECTVKVSEEWSAETRRELKRYQDAINPRPEGFGTIPNMRICDMETILAGSFDFYTDVNVELTQLGRPTWKHENSHELHTSHKELNKKIYQKRQTEDKMIPSFKRLHRTMFPNDVEHSIFMGRVEQVSSLRAEVWERTSRLLVWCKSALALTVIYKNEKAVLKKTYQDCKKLILGRPSRHYDIHEDVTLFHQKMKHLKKVWTELRKICKTDSISEFDKNYEFTRGKCEEIVKELHSWIDNNRQRTATETAIEVVAEDLKQLRREKEELEEMVQCPICMDNKKQWIFRCGHMICDPCLVSLQTRYRYQPMVPPGFRDEDVNDVQLDPVCPTCMGPIQPRRRIYF